MDEKVDRKSKSLPNQLIDLTKDYKTDTHPDINEHFKSFQK